MNLETILSELRSQRDRIEKAIAALGGIGGSSRAGRPAKTSQTSQTNGRHRTLSAAARKKISEAQKARWAKQKRAEKAA